MEALEEEYKNLKIQKLKLEITDLKSPKPTSNAWNSLELVKLIASLSLPVVLFFVSSNASSRLKEIENNQKIIADQNRTAIENNQRIYDMRFSIYKQISFRLNEIYCYFTYIGKWKELSPVRLIENKRFCDEIMYSNQSLFNPDFFKVYNDFMDISYKAYSGQGQDAKLRTDMSTHKNYYKCGTWEDSWGDMFQIEDGSNELGIRKDIHKKYNDLLTGLTKELNIDEVVVNNQFKDNKPSE
ncbi:MAG: hypothetical protein J0I84_10830 [Terrimonas sp.]|nr:hypothetical protein [Terrimonas sp.]OJY93174.1 MAG: hypothetical protein BGP13_16165 [Sphingobacteriales bacterium 40-81]